MNELVTHTAQLPEVPVEAAQFVLVTEERARLLRESIKTINKVGLAKEVYDQKLAEAQEVAEIAVDAARQLGLLLMNIQKQSGMRTDLETSFPYGKEVKTKTEITSEMGLTPKQVSQYQQMAQNPEAVQAAIKKAIENGDVVSRTAVMKQIQQAKEEARREAQEQISGLAETIKAQSKREARQEVEAELKALRQTNKTLKEQAEKTATVIKPDGYEDTLRELESAQHTAQRAEEDFQRIRKEYAELKKENQQLKDQIGTDKVWKDADKDIRQFTAATNNYIRMYGGHAWAFAEIENISADARRDFLQAIRTLDGFAQQMIQNLGGLIGE